MKVSIDISTEYKDPFAVIHTDKVTDEVQRAVDLLGANETPVTAFRNEEDIVVLKPEEIYMVRVENGDTISVVLDICMNLLPSWLESS